MLYLTLCKFNILDFTLMHTYNSYSVNSKNIHLKRKIGYLEKHHNHCLIFNCSILILGWEFVSFVLFLQINGQYGFIPTLNLTQKWKDYLS